MAAFKDEMDAIITGDGGSKKEKQHKPLAIMGSDNYEGQDIGISRLSPSITGSMLQKLSTPR